MHLIKNILTIVIVSITIYGVVGLKSIAYCCGHCNSEKVSTNQPGTGCCESENSCCHHTDAEKHCPKNPCQVYTPVFDWDVSFIKNIQKTVLPAFDIIYLLNSLPSFDSPRPPLSYLEEGDGSPPVFLTPRDYLSYIRILLI